MDVTGDQFNTTTAESHVSTDAAATSSITSTTTTVTNAETIANRVRKRHRDVIMRSSPPTTAAATTRINAINFQESTVPEEELAQLSDFVGILPAVLSSTNINTSFTVKQHDALRIPVDMPSVQDEPVYLQDNFNRMTDERFRSNVGTTIHSLDAPLDQNQQECVMLSRSGGRSYLCNQCPFEANELVTVFRHLFAAHIFRCGRCNFYCTSRWRLRRHEQSKHNAFIDEEYAVEPLSETVARLPSSRTPRLMNGLAGFVPSSIVTPIAVKNQHANLSKSLDKTACAVVPLNQTIQQQKSNASYLFDNKCDNLGYKCKRCDYTSMLLGQMRAHCSRLAEYAFICPGHCHFGSVTETETRAHYFICRNQNLKANQLISTNFINKDRFNVDAFFCTYDPKDDNSSVEFEDMRNRLNPDADLMKQIGEPGIFLLKRNAHEEESLSLIDQISVYGSMAAEKMYPQLSNKRPKGKIPLVIRGAGLTIRSNKSRCISASQTALNEFLKSRHQFILSSEELVDLPCPTEQSPFVQCAPHSINFSCPPQDISSVLPQNFQLGEIIVLDEE
ncbi:hypothetical protein GJ496_011283 [Pomphorhynchus laevis]|nr:hypothetical protein GJ496_011283 [Pomphorhynchus laevis]